MKNMKKLASLLLALVMVFSLATTAFAANTNSHTITITNTKAGHTYEAYQIFQGDISDGKLVNIEWGSGVKTTELLTALKGDSTIGSLFTDAANAEDVANVISAETFTATNVDIFAQIVGNNLSTTVADTSDETKSPYEINVTGDGYYLVKDQNNTVTSDEDAYTKYILKVVGDVEVEAKADAPTLIKKIVEDSSEKDANTKDIGETVDYKLTSKVPDMDGYNKYFFIVHDTMSEGLTFDSDSVEVTIDNNELGSNDYDVVTSGLTDGCTFEIVFKNFIQHDAGDDIVITYSALVNEKAEVGVDGNTNTAKLQYSNNPNVDYKGETSNPDRPTSTEPTGKTPDDTVITYTTEIKLIKVDKNDNTKILTGAKFSIRGVSSNVKIINSKMYVVDEDGDYYRLKDGSYTDAEPVYDDEKTEGINEDTAHGYDSTTVKYKEVTEVTEDTVDEEFVAEGWVKEDGTLTFTGLGEGTYTIKEIVAPEGYNLLKEDITVVVTSNVANITDPTASSTVTWTAKDGTGSSAKSYSVTSAGKIEIPVENTTGTELPSTGGMGTTLFYVFGGILVVAAVVLLVTKKRMNAAE